jgi:hypothetical protein
MVSRAATASSQLSPRLETSASTNTRHSRGLQPPRTRWLLSSECGRELVPGWQPDHGANRRAAGRIASSQSAFLLCDGEPLEPNVLSGRSGVSAGPWPSATDSSPKLPGRPPGRSHQLRWVWPKLFFVRDSVGRSLRVDPGHRLTGGASRGRSPTPPLREQLTYACVCAPCWSRTGSPPMASNGHSSSACCTLAITYV